MTQPGRAADRTSHLSGSAFPLCFDDFCDRRACTSSSGPQTHSHIHTYEFQDGVLIAHISLAPPLYACPSLPRVSRVSVVPCVRARPSAPTCAMAGRCCEASRDCLHLSGTRVSAQLSLLGGVQHDANSFKRAARSSPYAELCQRPTTQSVPHRGGHPTSPRAADRGLARPCWLRCTRTRARLRR